MSFELQMVQELPQLAGRATNGRLKRALLESAQQTKTHLMRAYQLASEFGVAPDSSVCVGMCSLIREGNGLLHQLEPGIFLDYALIGTVQKLGHYEIAAYGPALSFARLIGRETDEQIIEYTLQEEYAASDELTGIGEALIIDMDRFICGN